MVVNPSRLCGISARIVDRLEKHSNRWKWLDLSGHFQVAFGAPVKLKRLGQEVVSGPGGAIVAARPGCGDAAGRSLPRAAMSKRSTAVRVVRLSRSQPFQ